MNKKILIDRIFTR